MKITFMGTGDFSLEILKMLNEKYDISLVISQPDREKKKGVLIKTPVAQYAIDNNLKLLQPENLKEIKDEILNDPSDSLITASFGQYIPSYILDKFKIKLNVHASILPYHRGGAPIQRAIMEGDSETGISIMEVSKGLDKGGVYAIRKTSISEEDDSSALFKRLALIGKELLDENLQDIYNGTLNPTPQDEEKATFSPNLKNEEEIFNFNLKSEEIRRIVMALAMEPGAYFIYKDIRIKIYRISKIEYNGNEKPGTILDTKKRILIKTIDGAVTLDLIGIPGKRIMSGKDYTNGQKLFIIGDII